MESHGELCLRILVGALLGSVIGYERDLHGHPAGLRTHMMVALASSTFMVVSTHFVFFQGYHTGSGVEVDGSRIAASVVSGIGFLAGGAIFRTGMTVKGLTTAGGLWLVSAVGLTAGAGMFIESFFSTLLGLVVLTLLRRFERQEDHSVPHKLTLTLKAPCQPPSALLARLAHLGARMVQTDCDKHIAEGSMTVLCDLRLPHNVGSDEVLGALESEPGVLGLRLQRME